ncbi:hypothetical protein [uncultured Methanoregula sp.]|uniref:hypothetical protein n=1 Tax=uncultured Methanoregula sp. TaxID=1005933 RepID=UPI002AABACCE|nr:hypothetical protein [uncultured Methanoregula sp.]
MPHEFDQNLDETVKEPVKDLVKEPDKNVVPLRKDNKKTYPCQKCGEVFESRQARYYHQKKAKNPCCPEDAEDLDQGLDEIPIPHSDTPAKLTGDVPPIPLFLVVLIMMVLVLLGALLLGWETLYKWSRRTFGGGDQDAGPGE